MGKGNGEGRMNIFTTVISGELEQVFNVLSREQHILVMTDSNVIKLDQVQSFTTLLDKNGYKYTLISDLPAEPTNHDVENLLNKLPQDVDTNKSIFVSILIQ